AVNLRSPRYYAAFRVVKPGDLVYVDPSDAYGSDTDPSTIEGSGLLPDKSAWKPQALRLKRNQPADVTLPLRDLIGATTGMLLYGAYADVGPTGNGSTYFGAVQLTDLGVFAQWFPSGGLVLAHHLSDGSPAVGARVEIYPSKLGPAVRYPTAPCAVATTAAG